MFSGRHQLEKMEDGRTVFLDRNPKIFSLMLDYLRNGMKKLALKDADA